MSKYRRKKLTLFVVEVDLLPQEEATLVAAVAERS